MYIKPLKGRIRRNIYDKRIYMSCNFETTLYKNIHYVYLIGLMYLENGKNQYKTFSLDDKNNNLNIKNNSLSIIKDFLNFILFKFNKKFKIIIYFHNLRSFHGFFIIECINKFFKDIKKNIVIKNNLIYKIELSNLIFLDILNIYNKDLDILSLHLLNKKKNTFNIEKIKTLNDIEIYYKEINNYLYTNVYLLYEIVKVIIKHFFIKYNVDIVLNFTISSISMHIYRTNYLKNNFHIEITKKHKYQFIKHSYYGGLCNVHYTNSKNGYYYDVNSLYPYVMMNNKMPLGKGYFISNIKDVNIDNYFGFISCNVFVPKELTIPPLPMRNIKNINILANGYLKGIWFSEELKNAITLGCKITKIYKVLNYDTKQIIFEDFVKYFNEEKEKATTNIEKIFNKNIMNSLYGRFGISLNKTFTDWNNKDNILLEHFTTNTKIMDNNITLYCLDDLLYEQIINNSDFKDKHKDIAKLYKSIQNSNVYTISSIQISSAISSYARIKMINEMYEHKIKNKATIFYYDTDSIFTNKLLPEHKVDSKKIGLFKLEKTYKKALFIAPKVYCLLERNNNEIIKFKSLNQKNLLLTYNYLKKYLIKGTVLEVKNVNIPIKKNIKDLKIYNLNYNYIYDFNSSKYQKIYVNNYFYKTIPIYIKKSYWD